MVYDISASIFMLNATIVLAVVPDNEIVSTHGLLALGTPEHPFPVQPGEDVPTPLIAVSGLLHMPDQHARPVFAVAVAP